MIRTSLRIAALAAAFAAAPALAYDTPPTPPTSSSGGSSSGGTTSSGSSGGSPTSIPEPAAIGLFALGIAGAAVMRRRRKRED